MKARALYRYFHEVWCVRTTSSFWPHGPLNHRARGVRLTLRGAVKQLPKPIRSIHSQLESITVPASMTADVIARSLWSSL